MIHPSSGDVLAAPAEALVNTVNCVGVMGRGIALQFKNAFPNNYKQYAQACKRKEVQPGRMFITATGLLQGPRYIINFPTKRHWRGKSRLEDIEAGLIDLVRVIEDLGITSIAIPPLGCGLGGLAWPVVKSRIEASLAPLESVQIHLYTPISADSVKPAVITNNAPSMTPGRAALIGLMHRYLEGLLDPFVSLLEVHKLMYFLQEAISRSSFATPRHPTVPMPKISGMSSKPLKAITSRGTEMVAMIHPSAWRSSTARSSRPCSSSLIIQTPRPVFGESVISSQDSKPPLAWSFWLQSTGSTSMNTRPR